MGKIEKRENEPLMSQDFVDLVMGKLEIPETHRLSSIDIQWDGKVVAAIYPKNDFCNREDLPLFELDEAQKEQMSDFIEYQKTTYPNENLGGGALVLVIKDGKVTKIGARVTRESGGWSAQNPSEYLEERRARIQKLTENE